MSRVAFCTVPHTGGIYSVYQRLRSALQVHGWDVRCLYSASEKCDWYGYHPSLVDEGCVELGDERDDLLTAAQSFVRWIEENDIDVVVPMSSKACLSAIPHFPSTVQAITRCIDITPHAYRLAATNPNRTAAIVVTSTRQQSDLSQKYRIAPEQLSLISNAVDVARFSIPSRNHSDGVVRLGFVDRIDDRQKNVIALPAIAAQLNEADINWNLQIVGAGPDEELLKSGLAASVASGKVQFTGAVPYAEMPRRFAEFDILVKPTRFEGFPSSLIEAMSTGVVPICSRIAGVTDWIISDGQDGRLVPIGDSKGMADAVISLYRNRSMLKRMSGNARQTVERRFNLEDFGGRWNDLFTRVVDDAVVWHDPLPWSQFQLASPWNRPWKERVLRKPFPRWFKDWVRTGLEKRRLTAAQESAMPEVEEMKV